jgi:hypothetical protein
MLFGSYERVLRRRVKMFVAQGSPSSIEWLLGDRIDFYLVSPLLKNGLSLIDLPGMSATLMLRVYH